MSKDKKTSGGTKHVDENLRRVYIDENLRRVYKEAEEQEVPDRFKDLLQRLRSQDRTDE